MFKFKGISSKDMQVIVEEEEHFIARAAKRYEITEIEGRDGAEFFEQGYSYIERPIKIQCLNSEKIDDILEWLDGEGEFEYNGKKTIARFYDSIEPQRESCIKVIETNFIRDPFWNKVTDEYVEVSNTINNTGNIISRPIIKLIKTNSNSVGIVFNGTSFSYNFNNDDYVEINCENKTALYNGFNRSRNLTIGYDWPKLDVGENVITIDSGNCEINVKRKDRWL